MKTLVTFVLLSLICFLCSTPAAATVHAPSLKQGCCQSFTHLPIIQARVRQATLQIGCHLKAIVVTTVCDKKICLDGKRRHAQNLLQRFQKSGPSNATC